MRRKRRVSRKRYMRAVIPRAPRMKREAMAVRLRVNAGTVGHTVSSGWVAYPFTFQLNQLPQITSYQSIFDQYRVNAIKYTFTPYYDNNDAAQQVGSNVVVLPRVYTCIDRNGIQAGSINTENSFLEYGNCKQILRPAQPFSIYVNSPGIEGAVEDSSGVARLVNTRYKQYLDITSPNISHFGCAVGWVQPAGLSSTGWYYNAVATVYLQFKNVR